MSLPDQPGWRMVAPLLPHAAKMGRAISFLPVHSIVAEERNGRLKKNRMMEFVRQ